jgi:hypothetical protein
MGGIGGGSIPAGQWGWVGEEGPEPAYGGSTGLTVVSNRQSEKSSGKTENHYHMHFRSTAPTSHKKQKMLPFNSTLRNFRVYKSTY